jgi:hypothetical protein
MNGYDFVVPALAMPFIPLLYYGFRDGWGRSTFVKRLAALALALLAAVFISILILAAQLQISEGSFAGGIASILGTFGRRTYGDPNLYPLYAVSLEANPWSVLWTYISQDTAINLLGLRFLDLIIIFAIFSVIYVILGRRGQDDPSNRNKTFALIGATWFSILSPLSWFLMFKGQAYVHTHTNYLAWHMPFTLFGFALCGFVLRFLITAFVTRRTSAR